MRSSRTVERLFPWIPVWIQGPWSAAQCLRRGMAIHPRPAGDGGPGHWRGWLARICFATGKMAMGVIAIVISIPEADPPA